MNTYVGITITNYGMDSKLNHGYIYISINGCQLEMCHRVSIDDAVKELAKLAKRLGKAPTFTINEFDPSISYRELHGYLD
jgi:hypothetical protein